MPCAGLLRDIMISHRRASQLASGTDAGCAAQAMALMVPLKPKAEQAAQPKVKVENWGPDSESAPEWAGLSVAGQDMQRALADLKANVARVRSAQQLPRSVARLPQGKAPIS